MINFTHRIATLAAVGALVLAVAPTAFAGKASGAGSTKRGGGTMTLVTLNSSDGLPHWAQDITWQVSTTATDRPFVAVSCTQGGSIVFNASAGYYAGYRWDSTMTLSSQAWTGGAASCTARLYYTSSNGREITLNTLGFQVYD